MQVFCLLNPQVAPIAAPRGAVKHSSSHGMREGSARIALGSFAISSALLVQQCSRLRSRRGCCQALPTSSSEGSRRKGGGRNKAPHRADLFLQLPFENGVLLSGALSTGPPEINMLPMPTVLPHLAIVPVLDGGSACVPFVDQAEDGETKTDLRRRLSPGPVVPQTPSGQALQRVLEETPKDFERLLDYDIMRACFGSGMKTAEKAEVLLLSVYTRFCSSAGAPPRPAAGTRGEYETYAATFEGVAMKALEFTASADFCLIAKAHVLGLAKGSSFPRLTRADARSMYKSAMRFGHALRQAEVRYQVDGAAGTFVPLPLEAELLREELENCWSRPAAGGHCEADVKVPSMTLAKQSASDMNADERLKEVTMKLKANGGTKPGLATYLGWLGKFDPEALSLLSTPCPDVAAAMQMQVDAVWGEGGSQDAEGLEKVDTTPSDMIEAMLFGAWLRDAALQVEDAFSRHQQGEEQS
eukprot:CAMPEP_0197643550 /NCGR_PEP_ID=MMETSP1338-20131121/16824_1 /TAXON_ID=43686 ORGANISM="Pelagodinium beii, Strain RCC1491" /NCGR_SAMPLE_ID=MMETSP1338 /ASSEMBLY_ACC=CAM_ASM_000754 /LENGTH=470 /DNA_ID=CAMNT_0043216815 /DNA_START=9 /DNA_END=1421 /DNA_ORIENTATION=+